MAFDSQVTVGKLLCHTDLVTGNTNLSIILFGKFYTSLCREYK